MGGKIKMSFLNGWIKEVHPSQQTKGNGCFSGSDSSENLLATNFSG